MRRLSTAASQRASSSERPEVIRNSINNNNDGNCGETESGILSGLAARFGRMSGQLQGLGQATTPGAQAQTAGTAAAAGPEVDEAEPCNAPNESDS